MKNNNPRIFERIYQKYSPMLYAIALEITSGEKQAARILKDTFRSACDKSMFEHESPSYCFQLIKVMIQEIRKEIGFNDGEKTIKLKQFEQTPLIHYLLCKQISLDDHCLEKEISKEEGARHIRDEFNFMRGNQIPGNRSSDSLVA
jgi:hypothetical protein